MSNFSNEFSRDKHCSTGSRCKSLRTQDGGMLSFFTYSLQTLQMNMASVAGVRLYTIKGEVKAKIKISPVVVFGVLSRMVVVRGN